MIREIAIIAASVLVMCALRDAVSAQDRLDQVEATASGPGTMNAAQTSLTEAH